MSMGSCNLIPMLFWTCLVAGCSSGSGPKLATADGSVEYMGKPLKGATVMFVPEKGPLAMGITSAEGKFQLSTGPDRGVVVGPVRVTVTAAVPGSADDDTEAISKTPQSPAEAEAYMKKAGEMQKSMASGKTNARPIPLIPEKYGKADTSGLSYTIKANGDNHFAIKL